MNQEQPTDPTRVFWIVSGVALAWNAIGIMTYLMSVTMSADTLNAMSAAERALYADTPAWATSAYAIAVFGGTLGCVGLLLRKAWALPLLIVSLLGIVVQMSHAFLMSAMLEVRGAASAVLPLLLIVIAACLAWFAVTAKRRGWIR